MASVSTMATQPSDDRPALEAEHQTLKQQTAELRNEHNRLQTEGGTKEEHRQLIRKQTLRDAERRS
jgi:hypothetical protein